ncbi:MAG: phosphatidylserine decarboxylase [Spirochaetes bacterium]|nr:phosphatidylserine decarboxylase [Spirochaetota bacterium]
MKVLKEGYPFIFTPLAAAALLLFIRQTGFFVNRPALAAVVLVLAVVSVVFAMFCAFFFRDPKIEVTAGENIVLSPCNGTVMNVEEGQNEKIVRVFLSVFSVHLQRSPVAGRVTDVKHQKGKFLMAWDPAAHSLNEQNIITIAGKDGVYTVKQIAGFLARRCVSWVKPGDELAIGDKIGMIKFSSQVNLYMPLETEISVKAGDKVEAGVTVIGTKKTSEKAVD